MGTHKIKTIEDLKAAAYNPRRIAPEAMHGLKRSVREFGDISGLVWNSQSGHLVAGHQRLTALRTLYGDELLFDAKASCIVTPQGERFGIRVVDWDPITEKAANVAANNSMIAGEFTEDLSDILDELKDEIPDLCEDLRFDELGDINEPLSSPEPPAHTIAGQGGVGEKWAVLIEVRDEDEQRRLLERFIEEGLRCRGLIL